MYVFISNNLFDLSRDKAPPATVKIDIFQLDPLNTSYNMDKQHDTHTKREPLYTQRKNENENFVNACVKGKIVTFNEAFNRKIISKLCVLYIYAYRMLAFGNGPFTHNDYQLIFNSFAEQIFVRPRK